MFDFAARAANQISLKEGDRIGIISKTGEGHGWWKGRNGAEVCCAQLQPHINSFKIRLFALQVLIYWAYYLGTPCRNGSAPFRPIPSPNPNPTPNPNP